MYIGDNGVVALPIDKLIFLYERMKFSHPLSGIPCNRFGPGYQFSPSSYSNCVRITKNLRNKVGKNTQHMMQNELKKKDDVIQKLNNEVNTNTKTRDSIKNDLKIFLAEKLQEMEEKTRTMIKEEIKHTTEIMTET
eukprot:TCONS_00034716-protein